MTQKKSILLFLIIALNLQPLFAGFDFNFISNWLTNNLTTNKNYKAHYLKNSHSRLQEFKDKKKILRDTTIAEFCACLRNDIKNNFLNQFALLKSLSHEQKCEIWKNGLEDVLAFFENNQRECILYGW